MLPTAALLVVFALLAPEAIHGEPNLVRVPDEEVRRLGDLLEDSFDTSKDTNFDRASNPLKTNKWPSFSGNDLLFPITQCKINGKVYRSMFQCPSRLNGGFPETHCVSYGDLCDGHPECPNMEDEHPLFCLFHKLHDTEISTLRRLLHEQQSPRSPRSAPEATSQKVHHSPLGPLKALP